MLVPQDKGTKHEFCKTYKKNFSKHIPSNKILTTQKLRGKFPNHLLFEFAS